MFVDKLVRNILDVLLDGDLVYSHLEMVKYLSGDSDLESIEIKAWANTIIVEVPKYDKGEYLTLNYKLNDTDHTIKLKTGKNILVDREKCISIILHKLL